MAKTLKSQVDILTPQRSLVKKQPLLEIRSSMLYSIKMRRKTSKTLVINMKRKILRKSMLLKKLLTTISQRQNQRLREQRLAKNQRKDLK